jgi:hypothetical protein
VQPATVLHWYRQGFRLFWRSTSQPGRPPIPPELQALIRQMAWDNPTWGHERLGTVRAEVLNTMFEELGKLTGRSDPDERFQAITCDASGGPALLD